MGHYERLSALDASFLEIEDQSCHMHVAAALIFAAGDLASTPGGIDANRIRAYIESRLHLIPRYRQKLAYIPLERHPVWIDDPSFNIFYHVRHTRLPRPGDERQLKRLCGRILSQKLDSTKPLWEIWVVEGLSDDRFALISKVHHCLVDGVSGVDLLTVLLSPEEVVQAEPAPQWIPRPAPTGIELLAGETWRRFAILGELSRAATAAVSAPIRAASSAWDDLRGFIETFAEGLRPASDTPLNPPAIGPHRRFDWLRLDLAEVKAIRSALGGTVNDVVLATVVGAMRRFLRDHRVDVSSLDFRALIPVSVRAMSEHGALGNKVAQMFARLPVDEASPRRRLERVIETTSRLKESRQVHTSELLEQISDWTAASLVTEMMRLAARQRTYNLIVTNVPGPQFPLFLLGAPLHEMYPVVPLFRNQALGIALFSYMGGLYWGLNSDWDRVRDLHDVVIALEDSFAELRDAANECRSRDGTSAEAAPKRSARSRRGPAGEQRLAARHA